MRRSHLGITTSFLLLSCLLVPSTRAEAEEGQVGVEGGGGGGGGGGQREEMERSNQWRLQQNIRNFDYAALHGIPTLKMEEHEEEAKEEAVEVERRDESVEPRRRIPLLHRSRERDPTIGHDQVDNSGDHRRDQHGQNVGLPLKSEQTNFDQGGDDQTVVDHGVDDRLDIDHDAHNQPVAENGGYGHPVIDDSGSDRPVINHDGYDRPVIDHGGYDRQIIDQGGYDRPVIEHMNTWEDNWMATMLMAGEEPEERQQGHEGRSGSLRFGVLDACEDAMCDQILRQAHGLSRMKKIRSFVRDSLSHLDAMVTSMEGELIQTGKDLSRYLGSACRSAQLVLQGVIKNTVDIDREPNIPKTYNRPRPNQENNFLQYIHAINNSS